LRKPAAACLLGDREPWGLQGPCGSANVRLRVVFAHPSEPDMPLYIIERNFAEKLDLTDAAIVSTSRINSELGVNWVFSFLSADKRKTYCLYEAKDPEAIREAARRANVPADVIVEVTQAFGNDPRLLAAAN
jgi:Protein of unknown function (DUF4242)